MKDEGNSRKRTLESPSFFILPPSSFRKILYIPSGDDVEAWGY
jgi:hypothetical protein